MLKSEIEYLRHIKEETLFIIEHTNSISEDDFKENLVLRKAIIRSLEVIGEATKRVNFDFKSKREILNAIINENYQPVDIGMLIYEDKKSYNNKMYFTRVLLIIKLKEFMK